jgi:hypothetical protein
MKEQIKTLAVKVFGMTDDEAQSLFKTDGEKETLADNFADLLSKKDQERISRIQGEFKNKLTEMHDTGYKKAQKEVLTKAEKEIKEKYGYETDKPLPDLVSDLVEMNKGKGVNTDIKTHPEYIKLERSLQNEFVPKAKLDEVNSTFESFKKQVERDKVISVVKEDARKAFRSLNPVLSKDPAKAANQEAKFLSELDSFDFQVQPDGNHVIMKGGERLENENLNPVNFGDFIKSRASQLYDFAEQSTKGNSGVDGTGHSSVTAFKDHNDFHLRYTAETDTAKRVELFSLAEKQGLIK